MPIKKPKMTRNLRLPGGLTLSFAKDGRLANNDFQWISSGETLAGAIAVRFTLHPGEKRVVPMVISWDLPLMQFGTGRRWYRRYTDFAYTK